VGLPEWYPRECAFCDPSAALACADPHCRKQGFGEHRTGCATEHDAACDCLSEVQPQ
jgi:hypothetical protein